MAMTFYICAPQYVAVPASSIALSLRMGYNHPWEERHISPLGIVKIQHSQILFDASFALNFPDPEASVRACPWMKSCESRSD
ncbi:hypothetical protein M404DRAFT_995569 [Pisolithus tinctorius Marx 270]|uniref:Uncharacterized protein n=1 Tax=Pisolithus tinctorius Marx 270 TaxID=870435 RepID=A0A0C3P9Z1_PISTI|nr:hypothetical protein M404DRAFT_995569 [Pisolithus tinctorius Marx 270]